MNPDLAFVIDGLIYRLGWTLVHTLWIGAAVAALFAVALVVLVRRSAQARYWAGCGALGLLLACGVAAFVLTPAPVALPAARAAAANLDPVPKAQRVAPVGVPVELPAPPPAMDTPAPPPAVPVAQAMAHETAAKMPARRQSHQTIWPRRATI